ncbi:uncharacterized protein LOC129942111 [Eupeodes corollae]|uniref:uncharacterized protein LOC129942111 n=1 Tax=Eupeodes corollae TaxID=290404 RepID=UPI002493479D|nr:uncharacterized protein LOC129942111 [Eupeodes corollae]
MELQARAGYRSQITKIVNEATEYLKTAGIRDMEDMSKLDTIEEDLASYLQRLTTANENLRIINNEFQNKNIEDSKPEKVAEYEDSAVGMMARLQVRLAKVQAKINPYQNDENVRRQSATPLQRARCTKLPKLELKKYSGDHQEWISFWENFRTTVHGNESLSGAEKFNYLQSVLTGNAAKTISGFTPTDTCYDGAISLLQEEYGDSEKLIDKLMQKLMALPAVHSKTDSTGLRNLYNTVISCSRSLTALGVPSSHYYIMLKTILLKCMPNELRIDYHRIQKESLIKGEDVNDSASDTGSTLSFDGDKQVKNILRFLKQEVESIERAGVSNSSVRASTHRSHTQPSTAAGLFASTQAKEVCFFCKSVQHSTKECSSSHTVAEKKHMLKEDGRCFRCTMKGHTARFCKARGLYCKKCKNKHPSSLCNSEKASSVSEVELKSKENSKSVAMLNPTINLSVPDISISRQNTKSYVFLQTARSLLAANSSLSARNNLFVRLIIDGGSQRTYVKEAVVNKLNLPIEGFVNLSIIPFGQDKISCANKMKIVKIVLKSQFGERSVEVMAVVVPEICLDVLVAPESKSPQLDGFCLADSNLCEREQEDGLSVLVGADYYWKVVTGRYKRITSLLTAVDTIFGWTLQGPCDTGDIMSNETVSTLFSSISFEEMWRLDTIGIRGDEMEMNEFTKELQTKCIRKTETRYEALQPWKTLNGQLGNNKEMALARLHSLLRRLQREPAKLREYDIAMRQFITAGYAERVVPSDENTKNLYYMPHSAVYRPEKTSTKI